MKKALHVLALCFASIGLLLTAHTTHAGFLSKQAAPDQVEYMLTFTPTWTSGTHPKDYPAGKAHFSGIIGTTHNNQFRLFKQHAKPTPGIENLSEKGQHHPLKSEINTAIAEGKASQLFTSGPIKGDLTRSIRIKIKVSKRFPMVSAVAMIAPSPDWFTGVSNVKLYNHGIWTKTKTIKVYAWDSGGDDGTTYLSEDKDTNPKKTTHLSLAPAFFVTGHRVPVGVMTFTLLGPAEKNIHSGGF